MASDNYLAVYFLQKTGEAYGSIRSMLKDPLRTTFRIDRDSWEWFKTWCNSKGLTTCFIIRCWIQDLRARETYREQKTKKGSWYYNQEMMGLRLVDWWFKDNSDNVVDWFEQPGETKQQKPNFPPKGRLIAKQQSKY